MEHGVADIQLLVHKEHSQLMGKKYKTFFLINPSSQWSCWKYFTLSTLFTAAACKKYKSSVFQSYWDSEDYFVLPTLSSVIDSSARSDYCWEEVLKYRLIRIENIYILLIQRNMSHDSYIENIYISHVTFSLTTKLLIRFHISYSSESTRVFFT